MKGLQYRRLFGRMIVLLMFLWIAVPQSPARADIDLPPVNPSGSNLGVGEGERTHVRMLEEEVNQTVEPTPEEVRGGYPVRGRVEAVFQMRNLGSTAETLDVWFPLASSARSQNMFPLVPDDPDREIHWASFPITFPSEQDAKVRVTYPIYPGGYSSSGWAGLPGRGRGTAFSFERLGWKG